MFSSQCRKSNFMLEKRFLVKYVSSFDQHIAKSHDSAPLNLVFVVVRSNPKRALTSHKFYIFL